MTREEWEIFFKDNGKMDIIMLSEWNKTFEEQRAMQCTKWPANHLVGQSKDFKDAKTASEANERQGVFKLPQVGIETSMQETIQEAKNFVRRREIDPYSVLFHKRINTDLTGDDWLGLDIVRRRFKDDYNMISDLLIVINVLSCDCQHFRSQLDDVRMRTD